MEKIVIAILIVVILAFLVFAIDLLRKHIMLQDIINKNKQYADYSNYYVRIREYYGDYYNTEECYTKDGNFLFKYVDYFEGTAYTGDIYTINGETRKYLVSDDEKILVTSDAEYDENTMEYEILVSSIFEKESKLEYIKMLMKLDISTEYCNGKECYKIKDVGKNDGTIDIDKTYLGYTEYIEKDTGLLVRLYGNLFYSDDYDGERTTSVVDYYYEFDTVTDEDFVEPDASEYKEV